MKSVNPATGETIRTYDEHDRDEVERRLRAASVAQRAWEREPFERRAEKLSALAELLVSGAASYAELMANEMGKPVGEGRAEVEKCAWVCRFYAENGARFLADELIASDAEKSYVAHRPLGIVLAVMPWNFPFWQVLRFGAPTLMAGNGALLKHASNVTGCALAIEELFAEAGFPAGLFATLIVAEDVVGELLENPLVAAATLTGSVRAGRAVAAKAGAEIKKTVLELGGSDPYLVLEDADIRAAAGSCVQSRLINSGQSCIAAKRFIVVDTAREEFEREVVERFREVKVGPPLVPGSDVGPMARSDLRDTLQHQVRASVDRGARLLIGGELPQGPGWFYPPTVLGDVQPGMPAFDEELFGPVAAIVAARDEEHAIELANASEYGLGAAVFTRDRARGERIAAERLQAGACFVNGIVRSDPRLPFGGIKRSGYGRELARHGILEFVNAKTVYLEQG